MKEGISKKQLRDFGILLGFGFPLLIGWVIPLIGGHSFRTWTLWIGIPSLILAFLKPRLLFFPFQGWMKLGNILGWINSRLILGLVFIVILQPIAIFMRCFGYDPLRIKKNIKHSFREDKRYHVVDLTRIF